MKYLLGLIVMGLIIWGLYAYFGSGSLKNITIKNNAITVDSGGIKADFSISEGYNETYVLFGGQYYPTQINPISLSGLKISDARNIYATYHDFYHCKSPGASLAVPLLQNLNLILAKQEVLNELQASIKEHETAIANDGDRVCVSLVGTALTLRDAGFSENATNPENRGENMRIKDLLSQQKFYLINSSQRVNCKNLLDQP